MNDYNLMLLQTLVVGEGEHREFYGYMDGIGWVTSSTPIRMYALHVTMTNLKHVHDDHDFTDVRLVRVKMQIIDDTNGNI